MKNVILLLVILSSTVFAQPEIEWLKCYGGEGYDIGTSIALADGEYFAAVGRTESRELEWAGYHGSADYMFIKGTRDGLSEDVNCFGGGNIDEPRCVIQHSSGNLFVTGISYSSDGDVFDYLGAVNFWTIRLNSINEIIWQPPLEDYVIGGATSISETSDNGVIIAGNEMSNFYLAKYDSANVYQWRVTTLGGNSANFAQETSDGGCIVVGYTGEMGSHYIDDYYGENDVMIVKLDRLRSVVWAKVFGGSENDIGKKIIELEGGGYIVGAETASNDHDVDGWHPGYSESDAPLKDIWIFRLNEAGEILWSRCLGGSGFDGFSDMAIAKNGDYILTGKTNSRDGDVLGCHEDGDSLIGNSDCWVVSIDTLGNINWQLCIGGSDIDEGKGLVISPSNDIFVTGGTRSSDHDITSHIGDTDMFVAKLSFPDDVSDDERKPSSTKLSAYPNPFNSSISIDLPENAYQMKIVDISGRVVFERDALDERNQISWTPQGNIESGIYLVKIISEIETMTQRIVYIK